MMDKEYVSYLIEMFQQVVFIRVQITAYTRESKRE